VACAAHATSWIVLANLQSPQEPMRIVDLRGTIHHEGKRSMHIKLKTGVQLQPTGETELRHCDAGEVVEVADSVGHEVVAGGRAEELSESDAEKHYVAQKAAAAAAKKAAEKAPEKASDKPDKSAEK
jgi:hypothetical protein